MRKLIIFTIKIFFSILSKTYSFLNISKNKIIVISSINYTNNSRYLFEYISKSKNSYEIFWVTNNLKIKKFLEEKNLNCAYTFFEQLHYISLAKIAVFSGTVFDDRYSFLRKETIKYCLDHGSGITSTIYFNNSADNLEYLKKINKVNYFNFCSDFTENIVGRVAYKFPNNKIIKLGYPRIDHLFNFRSIDKKNIKDNLINSIFKDKKDFKKIILYSPTWKRDKNKNNILYPLNMINGFQLNKFNKFLKKNNYLLIYTTHPNSQNKNIKDLSNFKSLNFQENPHLDVNYIIPAVDVLITDFSTIITDILISNKSIILLLHDHKNFLKNEALLELSKDKIPGKSILSYKELITSLKNKNSRFYSEKEKKVYLTKYYNIQIKNSCGLHKKLLSKLIRNNLDQR